MVPKHLLPYGATCKTFAKPVSKVLFIEVASGTNCILSWVKSMKIMMESWMVTGSWSSKQYVIFSVLDLSGILGSLLVLINLCDTFVWWWVVANHFINYLYESEKDTQRMVLVTMVETSLVALSASSLPGMEEWPGIHWMVIKEKMELMELWI